MKFTHRFFVGHLDDGEEILSIWHRHPLVLKFASAKTAFFGIFVPGVLLLLFPKVAIVFVFWIAVGLFGMLYHFIDWYFDTWLLTNHGVIDIERNGLFDVTSTRIDYHMIEGISYNIKGFVRTVFNYGDIIVDKLGAQTQVILRDASSPRKLERLVVKYQEKYVRERSVRDHHALKGMLSEMIAYHVKNDKIGD